MRTCPSWLPSVMITVQEQLNPWWRPGHGLSEVGRLPPVLTGLSEWPPDAVDVGSEEGGFVTPSKLKSGATCVFTTSKLLIIVVGVVLCLEPHGEGVSAFTFVASVEVEIRGAAYGHNYSDQRLRSPVQEDKRYRPCYLFLENGEQHLYVKNSQMCEEIAKQLLGNHGRKSWPEIAASRSPQSGEVGDMNYRAAGIGDLRSWGENTGDATQLGQLNGDHG
ncbi:hypothetical protein Acr_15g0006270 [Actinidia rufa]|uniref:Uncharacterized protein n=1 Tax=Actinidia rufa TaxID=165716 RepID=A0A7J0FVQ4_9ERIC|nr:hypothetical protein Acr_15g0006270 [Actinidia rufa]